MDYVESVEFSEESLDAHNPAIVTIYIKFKSGQDKTVKFNIPVETPIYGEAITATTIYEIISAAYSFGEVPFLSIPDGDGYIFLDLSTTDYITLKVDPRV